MFSLVTFSFCNTSVTHLCETFATLLLPTDLYSPAQLVHLLPESCAVCNTEAITIVQVL